MITLEQRITQWEQMAREAPDDMAFLSLGNVYKEADRLDEAAEAYAKAIECNPGMSRAYQCRGQVLIQLDRTDEAADVLLQGYQVAGERGDVMPQQAIGSLLTEKLGRDLPEAASAEDKKHQVKSADDTVLDRRTGQPQPRLPDPPMRGPVGDFIYNQFGQDTWHQWIAQGTKVINELRLDFSNEQHQQIYEQHMLEWLQVSPDEITSDSQPQQAP